MSIRTLRAILIDPFACEVRELQLPYSDIRSVHEQLSHETMPVSMAQLVHLPTGDDLYVDEEGLMKPCERFFVLAGIDGDIEAHIVGKGLILGHTGDEIDSAVTELEWVKERVHYCAAFVGGILLPTTSPWRPRQ